MKARLVETKYCPQGFYANTSFFYKFVLEKPEDISISELHDLLIFTLSKKFNIQICSDSICITKSKGEITFTFVEDFEIDGLNRKTYIDFPSYDWYCREKREKEQNDLVRMRIAWKDTEEMFLSTLSFDETLLYKEYISQHGAVVEEYVLRSQDVFYIEKLEGEFSFQKADLLKGVLEGTSWNDFSLEKTARLLQTFLNNQKIGFAKILVRKTIEQSYSEFIITFNRYIGRKQQEETEKIKVHFSLYHTINFADIKSSADIKPDNEDLFIENPLFPLFEESVSIPKFEIPIKSSDEIISSLSLEEKIKKEQEKTKGKWGTYSYEHARAWLKRCIRKNCSSWDNGGEESYYMEAKEELNKQSLVEISKNIDCDISILEKLLKEMIDAKERLTKLEINETDFNFTKGISVEQEENLFKIIEDCSIDINGFMLIDEMRAFFKVKPCRIFEECKKRVYDYHNVPMSKGKLKW